MGFPQSFICLPPNLKLTVIKKNKQFYFYMYNNFFYYQINHPSTTLNTLIDKETNTIQFITTTQTPFTNLFLHILHNFLFSWDNYFFEKIKFTGKGYRIAFRKKKKIIKFYFGHSHDTIMFFRSILIKKPHKYKFLILKNSLKKIQALNKLILSIKPINIYTNRGLRNSRQILAKRKGKKSTY